MAKKLFCLVITVSFLVFSGCSRWVLMEAEHVQKLKNAAGEQSYIHKTTEQKERKLAQEFQYSKKIENCIVIKGEEAKINDIVYYGKKEGACDAILLKCDEDTYVFITNPFK